MANLPPGSLPRRRPTPAEMAGAVDRTLPDVIGPGLTILFCGINPGLYSAAVGHHFARPGNRFWKVLYRAGFTTREFSPDEEQALLGLGCGITNLVPRTTVAAAELSTTELRDGAARLEQTVGRYQPKIVAFCGMQAYRTAFGRPGATLGRQPDQLGGTTRWLLPSPSGLQATYQLPALVATFTALREAADLAG